MGLITSRRYRVSRFITVTSTFVLLLLSTFPSLGHFAAAAGGQYVDATDDFHVFTPQSDHATSYYPTSEYSSNDVSLVTWENVSGNYIFNITFQEDVNISHVMVDLSFFIDGDYASSADIPPYLRHEQDFDIYIVNQSHSRICYNYTLQKYFYSVHIHDNKTIECTLLSSWTYILDPIQHQLPMEEWFCVGLSYVKQIGRAHV